MMKLAIGPRTLALAAFALLASCGGGGAGDGGNAAPTENPACALDAQKSWLSATIENDYFWYASNPNPDPSPFADIASYFDALLFTGDASLPGGDIWSFTESSVSYNRFYGEGKLLGYGLNVAGIEIEGHPERPLRVRYVEPGSPAEAAGLRRGDTVVSLNGRPSADYNDDFGVLTPAEIGDVLSVLVRDAAGAERSVDLVARVFDLQPLAQQRVVASQAGKPIGYVLLKDFISQAAAPLETAFADFKARGVREIVLDLRYNGGGLISTASTLASYVAGDRAAGRTFALLNHSDKQQARNSTFAFTQLASALGASRVFVLSGPRTCSASELVVNGLKPFVEVVQIGGTTCGKPVGFTPVDRCGTTFSAVNFESLNAAGEGRYWDGIAPQCAVADDLDHALGDTNEALLAAARGYADSGGCPAAAVREQPQRLREAVRRVNEGERRSTMIAR